MDIATGSVRMIASPAAPYGILSIAERACSRWCVAASTSGSGPPPQNTPDPAISVYALRMTVTVRQIGNTRSLVRANVKYQVWAVEKRGLYQQFFAALKRAKCLNTHQTD